MSTLAPDLRPDARLRLAESLRSRTVACAEQSLSGDDSPLAASGLAGDPGERSAGDSVLVGVDLVPVADVADSVRHLGRRYLYRIFTRHERACARLDAVRSGSSPSSLEGGGRQGSGYSVESLAARFAAKEAAVKVLRPVGPRPEWRSIEVRRADGGWCELRLSGLAASLAADSGITTLAVSVTHEPMMAAACVIGSRWGDSPAQRRTPPPD